MIAFTPWLSRIFLVLSPLLIDAENRSVPIANESTSPTAPTATDKKRALNAISLDPNNSRKLIPHQLSTSTTLTRTLSYPFDQVWPSAIRYLRIVRSYEITERDLEAGYILFRFPLGGERSGEGSLEFIRSEDAAQRSATKVLVSTRSGPLYLPNSILDGLEEKLRQDLGAPPPPKKKTQKKKDDKAKNQSNPQ